MTIIRELRQREGALIRHIETLDRKIERLKADWSSMKGVLAHQRQQISPAELMPHMDFRRFFGSNELRRDCLQALKAAPQGLTSRDIARIVMARIGADVDDEVLLAKLVDRVAYVLRKLRFKKLVNSPFRQKGVTVWALAYAAPLKRRSRSLIGRS